MGFGFTFFKIERGCCFWPDDEMRFFFSSFKSQFAVFIDDQILVGWVPFHELLYISLDQTYSNFFTVNVGVFFKTLTSIN